MRVRFWLTGTGLVNDNRGSAETRPTVDPYIHRSDDETGLLRRVEDQSVPLAFDVIIFRLLSDIKAIKLQLSGQLFLSLEDDQRNLT